MSFEEQVNPLFQIDEESWLTALPPYQQRRIKQLLESSDSYEDAAKKWLTAIPENTFPFAAEKGKSIFFEKVWNEVEKFLCGDEAYAKERKELVSATEVIHTTLVSSLSLAIAPVIGTASAYVTPVVVLIFMTMGKISLNAWCQMRMEQKK
ncbi:hypothetical protein [Candidatus Kuenenia sp.]|jgi:hypothetical protein|uniref:hypothetical protein n=1 Tax=Candidatus Kuenenia sp. TaxID=2499824 RepID=UPI0032206F29